MYDETEKRTQTQTFKQNRFSSGNLVLGKITSLHQVAADSKDRELAGTGRDKDTDTGSS